MIVFLVSGLWHGASWTFVAWGALHGITRLCEHYFSKITGFKIKEGWSFLNLLLVLKTFLITSFIWVFFRADSFSKAGNIFKALVYNFGISDINDNVILPLAFSVLLFASDIYLYNSRFDKRTNNYPTVLRWFIYTVFIYMLMAMSGTQKFNFIYFQF